MQHLFPPIPTYPRSRQRALMRIALDLVRRGVVMMD